MATSGKNQGKLLKVIQDPNMSIRKYNLHMLVSYCNIRIGMTSLNYQIQRFGLKVEIKKNMARRH